MPPRKRATGKKKAVYVWGDTPEIEALGAGFAREEHFFEGFNKARDFANTLATDSTAVAHGQHHAQMSWGLGKYHPEVPSPPFFQAHTTDKILDSIKHSYGHLPPGSLPNYMKKGIPRLATTQSHLQTDFNNTKVAHSGFEGANIWGELVLRQTPNQLPLALTTTPSKGPTPHPNSPFNHLPIWGS